MSEAHARSICTWCYPPPYEIYDTGPWALVVENGWTLGHARRAREMLSDTSETRGQETRGQA